MAVMQTCCCCGVRQGSTACAIYKLIISIIGLVYFGWSAAALGSVRVQYGNDGLGILDALLAVYVIAVIIFIFFIIACIFVFVGISQDSKGMLIPFMVASGLHFLWYLIIFIVDAYFLSLAGGDVFVYGYAYLATIILLIPFLIVDIVCLLCVISQYQEYVDGRGRAEDQPAATTHTTTTVVVQQQAPPPKY